MTTKRNSCTECGKRHNNFNGLCDACEDFGMWENSHQDDDHENTPDPACPVCNLPRTGHTNTATKGPHRSHANCNHPRTPKGRAACRKAGGPQA